MEFKKRIANKIHFDGWGEFDDAKVLNNHDNHFQLAFRTGAVWVSVAKVFDVFLARKVKGQKLHGPKSRDRTKGQKKPQEDQSSRVGEMALPEGVAMQGIKEETPILQILGRVISGDLSFQEMAKEFDNYKMGLKIELGFCDLLNCETYEQVKEKYDHISVIDKWIYLTDLKIQVQPS